MKRKFLPLMLSLLAISAAESAYSQLNYNTYGTTNVAGTYTDLGTAGTVITTANFDDANSAPQNIGFTFNYNGTAFTQFVLNTNGFIKLGATNPSVPGLYYGSANTTTGGIFNSALPADANIISVFNHDLKAGTLTPEYRVSTTGSGTSHVCTIQYKNVHDSLNGTVVSQYDNMSFQIKLYETSNMIEFIYGTWAASANASAFRAAAVGLKGLDNTAPQLLVVSKASTKAWSTAVFIGGNYPGNAFNFGNGTRPAPDAGRTFRFTPALLHDGTVAAVYTLGSIPKPWGVPQTDSAAVVNIGLDTLKNVAVTLKVTGANTFTRNATIPFIAPGAAMNVGFASYSPATAGTNTVTVTLGNDDNNANNSASYTQVVNTSIYSYADAGAQGGSLGATGYLLAKYNVTGAAGVNGANIYISNNTAAITKSVYAILFDAAGNKLDSSSTLVIAATDTGKYHSFVFPKGQTITNGAFYVGIAQPVTGYFPLGYQKEMPLRTGAFFIRTFGGATFGDLGAAGNNYSYRLMIQAVVSVSSGIFEHAAASNLVTEFPNPCSDVATFSVKTAHPEELIFNLYDVTGHLVRNIQHINTAEFKMDKGDLPAGVYFYNVMDTKTEFGFGKLIVQ
jgi:hypothetical protein